MRTEPTSQRSGCGLDLLGLLFAVGPLAGLLFIRSEWAAGPGLSAGLLVTYMVAAWTTAYAIFRRRRWAVWSYGCAVVLLQCFLSIKTVPMVLEANEWFTLVAFYIFTVGFYVAIGIYIQRTV